MMKICFPHLSLNLLVRFNERVHLGKDTEHCLLYMLECSRKAPDKGMRTGILLTDLTQAFDSLSHDFLVAMLNSFGFSKLSLKMINDYLNDRKQRTRVNNCFICTVWCEKQRR